MNSPPDQYAKFSGLVAAVEQPVARSARRPRLGVIGEFDHFRRSVLGKVSNRYLAAVSVDSIAAMRRCDASIVWTPETAPIPDLAFLKTAPPNLKIINGAGFSPDKDQVEKAFEKAFGYSTAVNPTTYRGEAVRKSIRNAKHDGVVVSLPIEREQVDADKVYERLVENTIGEIDGARYVADIRLPMILGESPLAYLKFRGRHRRFSNRNDFAIVVAAHDVLSPSEIFLCQRFAADSGFDYGELDILRDVTDGKIYIVDANNTPFGPPNGLSDVEVEVALRLLGGGVLRQFFKANATKPVFKVPGNFGRLRKLIGLPEIKSG